ncbi:MAG TPA: glycosyltransferase family 39 protein [Pyrinomonadaceae bacterium]|nr:glycosyltransferase family 39 protein [Pyrinomonadaceae bacterium]
MRRYRVPLILSGVVLALALYAYGVPARPPGFYTDESSIAYNAYTVSETGRDEHGEAWPLFFRAFGEYKNPTYIYLLAALYSVTGPSIFAARLLSAMLGCAAALLLGLLAARCARRASVGVIVGASALLTPWLYESSRLVFEVAAYPLTVVLFLLALRRASEKERWSASDVAALAATLALLTYSYSIGRLLGPLLAAGLVFFVTRRRLRGLLMAWAAYALALVPLLVFHVRHPGALTGRFNLLTYVTPQAEASEVAGEFLRRFAANLSPWSMLVTGEPNIRDHVPGAASLLAPTFVLAIAGLILVLRSQRREAWWRFILYGLIVSAIPASLTRGEFPQLRLIAVPLFLHVLTIPALTWLLASPETKDEGQSVARGDASHGPLERVTARRAALALLALLTLAQGAYFQKLFHSGEPERGYVFESHYKEKVLAAALRTNQRPIYLTDATGHVGYVQAYWHGLLQGIDASQFVRLTAGERAPAGAVVISTEDVCADCRVITKRINYLVYVVPPSEMQASAAPLPEDSFRADLSASNLPATLKAGRTETVRVEIRNVGRATWHAVGQPDGRFRVGLRWRWLKGGESNALGDIGETKLPFDLDAGEFVAVEIKTVAPREPGEYVLELDMAQEHVAWFGEKGSKTLRRGVRVEK